VIGTMVTNAEVTSGANAASLVAVGSGVVRVAGGCPLANGSPDQIFVALHRAAGSSDAEWPACVSRELFQVSADARTVGKLAEFAFAAACILDDLLIVCWCGDVRVYLFDGDELRVTRDHTVKFAPDADLPEGDSALLRESLPTMYTRYVSATARLGMEFESWPIQSASVDVVICSNGYHEHGTAIQSAPRIRSAAAIPPPTASDFIVRARKNRR
jgi:hypothetical protein